MTKLFTKWHGGKTRYEVWELSCNRYIAKKFKNGAVERSNEFNLYLNQPVGDVIKRLKFKKEGNK